MRFGSDVYSLETYDVVVVGSGPSGIAAAIQASRKGLSVALIERGGAFGGNMTSGGVCHLLGGRRWDVSSQQMVREVGGLFDEITDSLISMKKAIDPDTIDVYNNNPFGWYPKQYSCSRLHIHARCGCAYRTTVSMVWMRTASSSHH